VKIIPKIKIEVVVGNEQTNNAVNTIIQNPKTGNIVDGKIFILPTKEVIRIRTGDRNSAAI
jgi:nitrogen regulatory protein P-II 1